MSREFVREKMHALPHYGKTIFFSLYIKSMTLGLSPKSLIVRNKANQKRWREHNPERVKELQKKHNSRPEVIEKKRIWAARNRNNIRKLGHEQNNILETTNVE